MLEYFSDRNGRPDRQRRGTAFLASRLDESLIEINPTDGSPPAPETGWLRPKDDFGIELTLKRQREARMEFLDARSLLAQLHSPSTIGGFRHRGRRAGQDLRGGADDIVKDMLVSQAFYGLHGPPGTGKTTVAAHAVEAYLRAERGARILVSAQSNYALDNLALRIRNQLSRRVLTDFLAIRVSSRWGEEKIHPGLRDWTLDQLGHLTLQFRMRRPIAEVISRAFYPCAAKKGAGSPAAGTLKTDPETEVDTGLRAPKALVGQALVWLDTQGVDGCGDQPRWANSGEARIVAGLLKVMKPPPPRSVNTGSHENPLAILTPYRDQIDMLVQTIRDRSSHIFSVHEFQGREADIVVASLVRDKGRGTNPRSNLGHLSQPELVNVLFSRARRLLVVVGNFRHFHESGVDFWRSVCETTRQEGSVVRADAVLSFDGGR